MNRSIDFHPLAEAELFDAIDHYDAAVPGLGGSFLEEIERVIGRIGEFPGSAPFVMRPVRRMVLRVFPYSVMYSERAGRIIILAIAHQKQHPTYWRRR